MSQGMSIDSAYVLSSQYIPGPGEEGFVAINTQTDSAQPAQDSILTQSEAPSLQTMNDYTSREDELYELYKAQEELEAENKTLEYIRQNGTDKFSKMLEENKLSGPDDKHLNKDGAVSFSFQGIKGDCWLLSSLNSLSYSTVGREIIKDSLHYTSSGTYVDFKGAGQTYYISDEEIESAQLHKEYSHGDEDVLAIELAYEKLTQDIQDRNVTLTSDNINVKRTSNSYKGGFPEQAFYALTGKNSYRTDDYERKNEILNLASTKGGFNYPVVATMDGRGDEPIYAQDINGNQIILYSNHTYSVVEATDEYVSFTDPYYSDQELIMDKQAFIRQFDYLIECNLTAPNGPGEA